MFNEDAIIKASQILGVDLNQSQSVMQTPDSHGIPYHAF